jgi:carbamoyl-phosphate synthase large subunit
MVFALILPPLSEKRMFRVLVLGAGGNAGINFVKSIKKGIEGVHVVGCDLDRWYLAACNSDEKVLITSRDPATKLEQLTRIVREHKIDFIHAQPDPEVRFLLEHASAFPGKLFDHSLASWQKFADKLACQKTWSDSLSLGFKGHALTELRDDPRLFDALIAGTGKAWFRAIRGAGSRAALPVTTLAQALSWADYWISSRGMQIEDFMVAEFLGGREYAVQTLWNKGELVHSQARCRLVYFFGSIMPSGQSSTPAVAETVDERDVYDAAYAAMRAIDPAPHGIYCADLKRNASNVVVPMEVNYGRFFTTSDFFASVGVNTPAALIDLFRGKTPAKAIESVKKGYVWIRGLDKEPYLHVEP